MKSYSFHPAIALDVNIPSVLDLTKPLGLQAIALLKLAGAGLLQADEICLSGKSEVAIAQTAALEMAFGGSLPTMTLFGFGQKTERLGAFSLNQWRHNEVRERREELSEADPQKKWLVIDGAGRGLEEFQLVELSALLGAEIKDIRVLKIPVGHVDPNDPAKGMVDAIIQSGVSKLELAWHVLYVPPAFSPTATCQATALYGLSEHWVPVIVLSDKQHNDGKYHVVEVVDVHAFRDVGTELLAQWQADRTEAALKRFVEVLGAQYGIGANASGSTFTIGFPDGESFVLNVSFAIAKS